MNNLVRSCSIAIGVSVLVLATQIAAQSTGPLVKVDPFGVPSVDITFEPIDAPHATCIAFDLCPPENHLSTEYLGFGLDFTPFDGNSPVAVFDDPPKVE